MKHHASGPRAYPITRFAPLAGFVLLAAAISLNGGACAGDYECQDDTDCTYGTFCRSGSCMAECRLDEDCTYPGMICIRARGYCRYPDGGVDDDGTVLPDGAPVPDGGPDATIYPLDGAPPDSSPPPDAATQDGIYTDPCTAAQQCGSGYCFSDPRASQDFCSGPCSTDNNCLLQHECHNISGDNLCQASDVGQPCTGPSQCANTCVYNGVIGVGHCTKPCANAGQCPAGYACTNVGADKVCVDISATCYTANDCLSGVCLGEIDYNFVSCTVPCISAADCPINYTCETDGYNFYCVPPTYGTGGLGDPCDGTTATCQSGLCLQTYCTLDCGVTRAIGQWCPPGYGCAIAGQNPYHLVCAVAGTHGFGQPCQQGNECASTVCREMTDQSMKCSRFCNDGIDCPSGYTCQPIGITASGVPLSVCEY
jgi:hypothetical protein